MSRHKQVSIHWLHTLFYKNGYPGSLTVTKPQKKINIYTMSLIEEVLTTLLEIKFYISGIHNQPNDFVFTFKFVAYAYNRENGTLIKLSSTNKITTLSTM